MMWPSEGPEVISHMVILLNWKQELQRLASRGH